MRPRREEVARAVLLASVVIQLFSTNYCATRFSCSIKEQAGTPMTLGSAAERHLGFAQWAKPFGQSAITKTPRMRMFCSDGN